MVIQNPSQQPLVEPLRPFDEDRALMGIESPDPQLRSESISTLKAFGTEQTARKIERRILDGTPSNMSKRALRDVLLGLTAKYRDKMDAESLARRRRALTQTVKALPALRTARLRRFRH